MSLVERFEEFVARTKESGQTRGFTGMIDAEGKTRFGPLPQRDVPKPSTTEDQRREASLDAARMRGRLRSTQILIQADMLTAEQFAERLSGSRMTVNVRRQKHELLELNGSKRGFRFPAWQWVTTAKPSTRCSSCSLCWKITLRRSIAPSPNGNRGIYF
jgi:hypothetical protein